MGPSTSRARVPLAHALRAIVFVLLVAAVHPAAAQNWAGATYDGTVTRVVDGDTIEVNIGGCVETVRYIGINTPEIDHPTRGKEPYGAEAARANSALVAGQPVRIMLDVQPRDRYSRLLGYVWVNGQFVNAELVRRGYAEAATYPPNVKYYGTFIELQRQARIGQAGLWGDSEAVAAYKARQSGVVGHKNTKVYLHHADPRIGQRDASEYVYFESEAEARSAGYIASSDFNRQASEEREARYGGSAAYTGASASSASSGGPSYSAPAGSGSRSTSRGDDVSVRGYTRQDGTVVAPYTRSAPGKGGQR